MRTRKRTALGLHDQKLQALLERYRCPLPYHAVRTHMLGAIASPIAGISPITTVKNLWGGNLPAFAKPEAAIEFMNVLVMGLWNQLTRHQERNALFALTQLDVPPTRAGLGRLARLRREELDGFIDGLFGRQASIDLPERAHHALNAISDIRAMLAGLQQLGGDRSKDASAGDVGALLKQVRELGKIAEHEIHAAVLSCAQARRQTQQGLPAAKPVLH